MSNVESVITMKNVQKVFGKNTALKDVSCNVHKGEIFGLLGPSGSGKTTIIKILTGQMKATSGETTVFSTPTVKITEDIYNKIGIVADNSGLYTRLSCYDNLKIFAKIYGVDKEQIHAVLEKVELQDALKKSASKLSKGMAQRIVLARAILHQPKLLFLDEPTSGLDPATSKKIHQLIFEMREAGTTIFLTTHNMEEATTLCDNIALLNDGVIIEYGNPKEICRKYNADKKISILLKSGELLEIPNSGEQAKQIAQLFENDLVESIHSSEPNLESVFIQLTGRKLV